MNPQSLEITLGGVRVSISAVEDTDYDKMRELGRREGWGATPDDLRRFSFHLPAATQVARTEGDVIGA